MKIILVPILAVIYSLVHIANHYLTEPLYLLTGAHLVHLPTGIKLFFVLIFGWIGVAAIFTSYLYLSMSTFFDGHFTLSFLVAAISSIAPMLSIVIMKYFYDVEDNYFNISPKALFSIAVIYSIINSVIVQLIIYIFEKSKSLEDGIFVMFIGDMTGIALLVLILLCSSKLIDKIKR